MLNYIRIVKYTFADLYLDFPTALDRSRCLDIVQNWDRSEGEWSDSRVNREKGHSTHLFSGENCRMNAVGISSSQVVGPFEIDLMRTLCPIVKEVGMTVTTERSRRGGSND